MKIFNICCPCCTHSPHPRRLCHFPNSRRAPQRSPEPAPVASWERGAQQAQAGRVCRPEADLDHRSTPEGLTSSSHLFLIHPVQRTRLTPGPTLQSASPLLSSPWPRSAPTLDPRGSYKSNRRFYAERSRSLSSLGRSPVRASLPWAPRLMWGLESLTQDSRRRLRGGGVAVASAPP